MSTLFCSRQQGDTVSATMEIQSGNRPPVLSGTKSTTTTSLSSFRPQATKASSEAAQELQKATKKLEKFDISLESLRMMFEKPHAVSIPYSSCNFLCFQKHVLHLPSKVFVFFAAQWRWPQSLLLMPEVYSP